MSEKNSKNFSGFGGKSGQWSSLFVQWRCPKKSGGYPLFKILEKKLGTGSAISCANGDILSSGYDDN